MVRGRSNEMSARPSGSGTSVMPVRCSKRTRRVDDDDRALAVACELRRRVWPLRQFRLRQPNDSATQVRIDGVERVDHVLGERQGNRA